MKKKIDVKVNSNHIVSEEDWYDSWDALEAINEIKNDATVTLSGKIEMPVCSPSLVEEYADTGLELKTDEDLMQLEDKEVCKVLAENKGGLITHEDFRNLTDIGTMFKDNTEITSFKELSSTKLITVVPNVFNGCTNLREVELPKTFEKYNNPNVTLGYFFANTSIRKLCFPGLKSANGGYYFANCSLLVSLFFPKMEALTGIWARSFEKILEVLDFGNNLSTVYMSYFYGATAYICRAIIPPTITTYNSHAPSPIKGTLFVPSDSVSAYANDEKWASSSAGVIASIGGTEWQSIMRSLAEQYAPEFNPSFDIEGADYSDEYIDYDIFGVERVG